MKFKLVSLFAFSALALTACGSAAGGSGDDRNVVTVNDTDFYVYHIPVDGRTVTCVDYYRAEGISCDWANAK